MNRQNINIDLADDDFNPYNKHIAPKGISSDTQKRVLTNIRIATVQIRLRMGAV